MELSDTRDDLRGKIIKILKQKGSRGERADKILELFSKSMPIPISMPNIRSRTPDVQLKAEKKPIEFEKIDLIDNEMLNREGNEGLYYLAGKFEALNRNQKKLIQRINE